MELVTLRYEVVGIGRVMGGLIPLLELSDSTSSDPDVDPGEICWRLCRFLFFGFGEWLCSSDELYSAMAAACFAVSYVAKN